MKSVDDVTIDFVYVITCLFYLG